MFEAERRRIIAAPVDVVKAALVDVENMRLLMPQAERVEVRGSTPERARVTIGLRLGRLGLHTVEGEARVLPNGMRFVAVQPAQIDGRWTVAPRGDSTEVTARLTFEPGGMLGTFGRFLPRGVVEDQIGRELDASLTALERLVETQAGA
jgi:carbon monoxide dehydrogenase subunit G